MEERKLEDREKRILRLKTVKAKLTAIASVVEDEMTALKWELERVIRELGEEGE